MILSCTTLTYPPSVIAFPKFQFRVVFKPALRELLNSLKEEKGPFQLPTAHCLWIYFHLSKLVEEGEVPFGGEYYENLDKPISCIPGLENILRRRGLPGICRFEKADDPILQFFIRETSAFSSFWSYTLNEIEAPMITRLGSFFNKIYAIGPQHAFKFQVTHQ
ncbi:hypothetical protein Patl1_31755 [Pistacia atlantica]|uniref:Uncharacterized protein n=1 Tax=Pistacia atlantica TaxID=434234 RepID=A0ACC1AQH9_9ROSI|nr:hypothetical protein Patl1_31755 [Pistacia atlantica]